MNSTSSAALLYQHTTRTRPTRRQKPLTSPIADPVCTSRQTTRHGAPSPADISTPVPSPSVSTSDDTPDDTPPGYTQPIGDGFGDIANEMAEASDSSGILMPGRPAISRVSLRRFKQFTSVDLELHDGVSLVAGPNNAGKSTLLHALAVWEFCRTATLMERGPDGLLPQSVPRQGFGIGDDEFSPINVPSLKHLWTNLKTAKTPSDPDGYTLSVTCGWSNRRSVTKTLGFALALANDRLFIKLAESDLLPGEPTPICGYLPPFAGILAREERVGGAIRRRRIGEGLAGAVLRNLLLDMHQKNTRRRASMKGDRRKITDADLRRLRETDPWELLQQTLRHTFQAEVQMDDFSEEYHSYIKAEIVKGAVDGYKLTRFPHFNARDLMVEGSGFLQWLSVYALAVTPDVNVLLFDEPDAHLHPALQDQLIANLKSLAASGGKQVLIATHSSEILRSAEPSIVLGVRQGKARYLTSEGQKVGMLAGIGSTYAPKLDAIRKNRLVLFYEGTTDLAILKVFAEKFSHTWPEKWIGWPTTASHKDRRLLWQAMCDEFGPVTALSLRDRDDEALGTVGSGCMDKNYPDHEAAGFMARKWKRRYLESYLLWPAAIAEATGMSLADVTSTLAEDHGLAIGSAYRAEDAPIALLDARGKDVLSTFRTKPVQIAKAMAAEDVCSDVLAILEELEAAS